MAMRNENSTSATTPPVASSCPVNHEARAVWLRKSNIDSSNNDSHNKINQKSDRPSSSSPSQPSSSSSISSAPLPQSYLSQPCDSSTIDQTTSTTATANPASTTRFTTTSTTSTTQSSNPLIPAILSSFPFNRQHRQAAAAAPTEQELDTERQVSSIPRVSLNTPGSSEDSGVVNNDGRARDTSANSVGNSTTTRTAPAAPAAAPAAAGNWIYPSERMFFDAMRRKSYDPKAEDMRAIVPIHNAVNEKAWKEIRKWEMGKGADKCGGPRLLSFSGNSSALTPRARLNTWLGYQAPFDRHDWVVDRCGTPVEYVIDFYQGRDEGLPGKSLNFYLDVRPKLNSWQGWRLRAERFLGI